MNEISEELIKEAEYKFYSNRITPYGSDFTDWMHGVKYIQKQLHPEWIEINHTDDCPNDNLDYWCEDIATGKVIVRHGYAIRIHNTKRYAKIIVPDLPK